VGRVDPPRVVNIADLRRAAKKRLPRVVFDYIDGGADAEWTMRENSRVFDEHNCDSCQGYFFSRPTSAEEITRMRRG
jgi:hypothetical protein